MAAAHGVHSFPSKDVVLGGHTFKLHGLAADEQYFAGINANFETDFYALCRRLIQPDYVCLDVGANIGVKSLFLSRHCPLGRIIAIEAGPTVARCLEANIAANNANNVLIEQTAAGDAIGSVHFQDVSAWGHVSQSGVEVPIATLEEIVAQLDLPRVDFIKIDTEGSELSIMRSSLDLINRFESLVLVELNSLTQLCTSNTNPRDFINWVLASFSHVFALNRSGSDNLLEPIAKTDWQGLLIRNMVRDGCITDLLVTNAPRRLVPSAAYLEEQLRASTARYASLEAELNAMRTKCDSLRGSASWRVTAPFRWLRDRLHI